MRIQTDCRLLTYEEPLELEGGSIAAVLGGFTGADAVKAECTWQAVRDGVMSGVRAVSTRRAAPLRTRARTTRRLPSGCPRASDSAAPLWSMRFAVSTQRIIVGGRTWEPADRQDKAIRTMGACRPIFLDESLLVLRAQIPTVLFIFARA